MASRDIAAADTKTKNAALLAIADALCQNREALLLANQLDVEAAQHNQLAPPLRDRLTLTPERIDAMVDGLQKIAQLPDPVGQIDAMSYQPSGLQVGRMRVPLGVIGIIYESRPNVTIDAAALCLKAGNAAILRGGSEAHHSNRTLVDCIRTGLKAAQLPTTAIQFIDTTDRQAVGEMLTLSDCIDVIIPRGGKSLIERISRDTRIPVIKHLDGICHVYIDAHAKLDMGLQIALNSKTYRYGICGAMETLLVDAAVAGEFIPLLTTALQAYGVELRGCPRCLALLPDALQSHWHAAAESDWSTEYLAAILAVRVVDDIDGAIAHIGRYGSQHTDAIVTERLDHAQRFTREVDSSSVMINAATCFADGYQYGLGAEIGISTNKLHVRGPVGLEGLTTQKYLVIGQGTVRQ